MVGHCFLVVYATAFFRPTATGPQLLNKNLNLPAACGLRCLRRRGGKVMLLQDKGVFS